MAEKGTQVQAILYDNQSGVSKYKTAAAEERAMIRRLHAYRAKRAKKMEGMTVQEQVAYINKLGDEAIKKLGIARFMRNKPDNC